MTEHTILVVEDNDILREGLEDMLIIEGYCVISAGDGVEALEKIEEIVPDLILSDIAMPNMDGFTFYSAVRKRSEFITVPFIFLTALTDNESILAGKNLGVDDYITKPVGRNELITVIRSKLTRTRQLQLAQLKQAYEASLKVLANAIGLRDVYTGTHVERVTSYAIAVGTNLGWKDWQLEDLRYGAILHDIGKIHVQESTLQKPGPLNEQELIEIQKHPIVGAEMIKDIPYLAGAYPIIRHHHERWDGLGYPDRLKGNEIPIGACIVALVDTFDAMITDRPYSSAKTMQKAVDELVQNSGIIYNPQVVEAFQKAWNEGNIEAIYQKFV